MDLNSFDLSHRALRKTDKAGDNAAISGLS
jgi:hypothetical protein